MAHAVRLRTVSTSTDLPTRRPVRARRRAARRSPRRGSPPARQRARLADHVLAEGVHPADDAVPRPVRVLHVRQAACPPRRAVPHDRRGARRSPARGAARRLPRGALHPGRGARGPLPRWRRSGWPRTATRRPSTTSPPPARRCSSETGLLPHANAGALGQAELERLRAVVAVAGDDDRDARGPARRARRPARRRARQDPGAPPRHARRRRARRGAVHHRHPRRHRRDPRRAARRPASPSATRTRATGTCRR